MWNNGYKNARERIEQYARVALARDDDEIEALDKEVLDGLKAVANGGGGHCTTDLTF
jgi:hypothetical protein